MWSTEQYMAVIQIELLSPDVKKICVENSLNITTVISIQETSRLFQIQKRYAHKQLYVHSLCNSRRLKLISKQMTSRHKDSDVNNSQQLKRKKKIIMGLSCNIFLHSGQKTLILGGRPRPNNSYNKVEVRKFAKILWTLKSMT